MRAILIGLFSVAGIAIAAPASAQGLYLGAPGVEVGVGVSRSDREHDGPRYRNHDYDRGRSTTGYSERTYDRGCRTITIRSDDGSVRRIRRCD